MKIATEFLMRQFFVHTKIFLAKKLIDYWFLVLKISFWHLWLYRFILAVYPIKWALQQTDNFSQTDWEMVQIRKINEIVNFAKEHTSYYATFFKNVGEGNHRVEFKNIPITTRGKIKELPLAQILTGSISPRRPLLNSTSGSTGEPLSFYQDVLELAIRTVAFYEELRFNSASKGPIAIVGLSTHYYLQKIGKQFLGSQIEKEKSRKQVFYPWVFEVKPKILVTTPALLRRLAHFAKEDRVSLKFEHILYRGEYIDLKEIMNLSKYFKSKIFSSYGTRECSMIAFQCKHSSNHLVPWLNYVEIISNNGESLPCNSEGNMVVTYFFNRVMPFIRYDIGDRGIINSEPCPCGRQTKTITFTGRAGGSIETPSGKSVMLLRISSAIAKDFHDEIARFQLEQTAPEKLIFRFVPSARYTPAADKRLTQTLQSLLYNEIACELDRVPVILPNSEGKTPIFIKSFR